MARTFQDLQEEALFDEFDSTKYATLVRTYINEGIRRVARFVRLPGMEGADAFTTTSGTASYALPSDLARLRTLRNTTDRTPLTAMDLREYDDAPSATGKPYAYATTGSTVLLYPTPNAEFNLEFRYWTLPAELTDGTQELSVIGFPEEYASLPVLWARSKMFALEDDPEMSQFTLNEFQRELTEMKLDVQDRRRVNRQIPGTVDDGYSGHGTSRFGVGGFVRP